MPEFMVKADSGKSYKVNAPDGASEADAKAYANQLDMGPALKDAHESLKGDEIGGTLLHGATLGFSTDMDALAAKAIRGAKNIGMRAMGHSDEIPYSADQADKATRQAEKENRDKFGKEHPAGQFGLELAGGMMTPGMGATGDALKAAIKGAGAIPKLARAATMGAGMGGAAAVGNAEGSATDRLKAAPGGAAMGAATGGGLHVGAGAVPRLAGAAHGLLGEAGNALRDISDSGARFASEMSPERLGRANSSAHRIVRDLIDKLDPKGEKLSENATEKSGKAPTSAEALGREGVGMLRITGRRSGDTPENLEAHLHSRSRGAGDRLVNDFHEITGIDPETSRGDMRKAAADMRTAAKPARDAWYQQKDIDSPELKKIMTTDAYKKAIGHAKGLLSNEYVDAFQEGVDDGSRLPLMTKSSNVNYDKNGKLLPNEPRTVMHGDKPVLVSRDEALNHAKSQGFDYPVQEAKERMPTARGWESVKRGLDQELEQFRDPMTRKLNLSSQMAQSILNVRNDLSKALTDPTKPWGGTASEAFAKSGDPIRMEQAFDSAKQLMGVGVPGYKFEDRLGKMGPDERKALQAGVSSEVRDAAMAGKKQLKALTSDSSIMKLRAIFGPEKANKLVERMNQELDLSRTGGRMNPNAGSHTADLLDSKQSQDEVIHNATRAFRSAASGNGLSALTHVLAAPVGGAYRGAQLPAQEATRNEIGRLLMMPPSELFKWAAEQKMSPTEMTKLQKLASSPAWGRLRNSLAAQGGAATTH